MNKRCLDWLYKQLKKKRIDLARAEDRNDAGAAVNLKDKVDIIEYLIQLVLEDDWEHQNKIKGLQAALDNAHKEQEAMLADLAKHAGCAVCKHRVMKSEEFPCRDCGISVNYWEWRGMAQKEG